MYGILIGGEYNHEMDYCHVGRFWCEPFVQDPQIRYWNVGDKNKPNFQQLMEKECARVNKIANSFRPHWKLSKPGFANKAKDWIRAAGLKQKDWKYEDVARCVCAGVGILAKQQNTTEWVFKRTMLRLERELRSWNNNKKNKINNHAAAEDPNTIEVSQNIRRHGGILNDPHVYAGLIKEARWDKRKTTTTK